MTTGCPNARPSLSPEPKKIDMQKVETLVCEALVIDGDHHKQWFLEQILEEITTEERREEYNFGWDEGIAP
jgi:hypothetical protein